MTRVSVARRGAIATARDLVVSVALARALPALLRYGASLPGVIAASAHRYGDRPALIDRWGELGYRQLNALVEGEAARFSRGERVGVMCRDGRWLLVAAAAAMRAGADAVLIGHASGEREAAEVLRREEVSRVVRDEQDGLRVEAVDGARSVGGRGRLVLLTSGTTGEPTAPRRAGLGGLRTASLLAATGIRAGEPVLVLPPLHHGHGLSLASAGLLLGAPVIVGAGLSLDEVMTIGQRAAVISGVPTQLSRLASHVDAARLHPKRIVSGSGRLSPALARRLRELYGPVLVDFFGTTATGTVTIATSIDLEHAPGTVGRPAAGVRIRVLGDDGRPSARGVIGEVYAASRPTGDLGWMDDAGRLFLAGRVDSLTVSGGENVSAAEVEDYLAEQPEVADVHVRPVPDEEFGSVLLARIVLKNGDATDLKARTSRELGRHKTPRIELVSSIERTATGKVKLP